MYSFIPQIFTELSRVQGTSHMLALSDKEQQGLFFPLGDSDDDDDACGNSTNTGTHWGPTGCQVLPSAFLCPDFFEPHANWDAVIIPIDRDAERLTDFPEVT